MKIKQKEPATILNQLRTGDTFVFNSMNLLIIDYPNRSNSGRIYAADLETGAVYDWPIDGKTKVQQTECCLEVLS